MDWPTTDEGDAEYNGPFSIFREWHAFTVGLATGVIAAVTGRLELLAIVGGLALGLRAAPTPPLRQLKAEPWYALGGVLIGYSIASLL